MAGVGPALLRPGNVSPGTAKRRAGRAQAAGSAPYGSRVSALARQFCTPTRRRTPHLVRQVLLPAT